MKRWLLIGLFLFSSMATAADDIRIGCDRLVLVLAPGLTDRVVERDWASGESHSEAPAVLELRGCKGELLDKLALEAPLARLDAAPLRGAPAPTYLVSVDLTAPAGSYSGPLTLPIQVVKRHLQPAVAATPEGRLEPIRLALTGKAAWKKVSVQEVDDLLFVSSQPLDNSFVTFYRRYHPDRDGWKVSVRSAPGLWESDGEFPEIQSFP